MMVLQVKNVKIWRLLLIIAFVGLVLALSGCGTSSSKKTEPAASAPKTETQTATKSGSADASKTFTARIISAQPGGSWFQLATELSGKASAKGVNLAVSPGDGFANPKSLANKDYDFAQGYNFLVDQAYNGVEPYDKKYDNLRHVATYYSAPLHVFAHPSIKATEFEDLTNKRLFIAEGGNEQINLHLLSVYGLNPDKIKEKGGMAIRVAWGDAVNMFKDKQIDAITVTIGTPAAAVMDLALNPGVNFVPVSPDKIKELMKRNPAFVPDVIKQGTYKDKGGNPVPAQDYQTFATPNLILTHKDVPDELVYRVTAALWDNKADIKLLKDMTIEKGLLAATIPVHPGAKKYYQEKGVKVD